MEPEKPINQNDTQKGCAILLTLIVIIAAVTAIMKDYNAKKEEKRQDAEYLQQAFDRFTSDSVYKSGDDAKVNNALEVIQDYPKSKEANTCEIWLGKHKIDTTEFKIAYRQKMERFSDSMYQANKNSITTPADDDMHEKAFIMAKDFVKDNLKAPASADFSGDFKWGKVGYDNTYIITSNVDAQNSFGANLRSEWTAKLTYNGGDWMDKSSWTLLDVTIE